MASELEDILASGDIPIVKAAQIVEAGTAIAVAGDPYPPPPAVVSSDPGAGGIPIPAMPAADAMENRIFFNTDNDRVCWKAPGGLVFRFRMQLI